jgi:hypothetical protein
MTRIIGLRSDKRGWEKQTESTIYYLPSPPLPPLPLRQLNGQYKYIRNYVVTAAGFQKAAASAGTFRLTFTTGPMAQRTKCALT